MKNIHVTIYMKLVAALAVIIAAAVWASHYYNQKVFFIDGNKYSLSESDSTTTQGDFDEATSR